MRYRIILLLFLFSEKTIAQDSLYVRSVIRTLTSEAYHGRGYVQNGDKKAARFIASEFKKADLVPFGDNYYQNFSFPVNTYPSHMALRIGDTKLVAGRDFIVDPGSPGAWGEFTLLEVDKAITTYPPGFFNQKWVLIDTVKHPAICNDWKAWKENAPGAAGVIIAETRKLTWSVSTRMRTTPVIQVLKAALPVKAEKIKIRITNTFILRHETVNVIGQIPGKRVPDSCIYFTAHYDHLGRMGKDCIFPGANDNASGVSMLLSLARWFSAENNRHDYTLVFIAFAGEEAGLIGSEYYTHHPLTPLARIRFLINMDLLGTGDEGLMVVNATEFPLEFSKLDSITRTRNLLPKIGQRGKAANSDHYWFTEQGVPSFFLYTLGGISAYHDIYDVEATLPLTRYREVFELIRTFAAGF
jgi:hypothetical protein